MSDELRKRAEARIGTVLRERYRLDAVLGVGGMAAVYLATHRNNKRFAVKILHPEIALQTEAKQRFVREGYLANTVDHPGALAVLDDDVAEDGTPFIVMELLDGAEVATLAENRGNALPTQVVLSIMDQVLGVLIAAHAKQIVHRDLKPANLFILRDGTVKVLDFGIARMRDVLAGAPGALTQTGALLGTPAFLPPEQAGGRTNDVDGQTDLWALGATMFTLLTGHYVHDADNATQIIIAAATQPARSLATVMPNAHPSVIALVDYALAYDKRYRWADARVMRDANREAYRLVSGGGAPARTTLAEMFGIATWETKWGELLQPPPGASGPILAALQSSPAFGPTTPMPQQMQQPIPVGMTPMHMQHTPPPNTAPVYVAPYAVNAATTGGRAVSSMSTAVLPTHKLNVGAIIAVVCAILCLGIGLVFFVVANKHNTVTVVAQPNATAPAEVVFLPAPSSTPTASASATVTPTVAGATASPTGSTKIKPVASAPAVTYSATTPSAAGSCHYVTNYDADGQKHFSKICP